MSRINTRADQLIRKNVHHIQAVEPDALIAMADVDDKCMGPSRLQSSANVSDAAVNSATGPIVQAGVWSNLRRDQVLADSLAKPDLSRWAADAPHSARALLFRPPSHWLSARRQHVDPVSQTRNVRVTFVPKVLHSAKVSSLHARRGRVPVHLA